MALTIEFYKSDGGKCRVQLCGRLDTHTCPEFDAAIASLDPGEFPTQVVDLEELEYVSSAGVRSLFKARRRVHDAGGQLLLLHPQPQVRRIFDLVKALPSTSIFQSEAEMDRYIDGLMKREG